MKGWCSIIMKGFLYGIVTLISKLHNLLLKINDGFERSFSDKELHFLVIGIVGMLLIFVIYPFFKRLAESGHVMVIAWIYVMTLLVVLAFAIEIGQGYTHTGNMEFADIVSGILGFLAMFAVFSVIRGIYHLILSISMRKP